MATKYITLKGKLKWAKVYEPDEYSGDKRWIVNFYPSDGKEWEKFQKSGLQLKVRDDDDGKFIVLRRSYKKLFGEDLVIFSPPEISGAFSVSYKNKAGEVVRSYKKGVDEAPELVGEQKSIGNGTVGLVNIAVYDTSQGKGHRLENIKILDLVEYVAGESSDEEDEDLPAVAIDPPPAPVKKKDVKVEEKDLNDDIPW